MNVGFESVAAAAIHSESIATSESGTELPIRDVAASVAFLGRSGTSTK
jgi:hypothetical protein